MPKPTHLRPARPQAAPAAVRHPWSVLAVGALLAATVFALTGFGCSLESPKRPSSTPASTCRWARGRPRGSTFSRTASTSRRDSTGATPLTFVLRGEVDSVEVGRFLDLDTPSGRFTAALGQVELAAPQLGPSSSRCVRSLPSSLSAGGARRSRSEPVHYRTAGPLRFHRSRGLAWARLSGGRVGVTVRNALSRPR